MSFRPPPKAEIDAITGIRLQVASAKVGESLEQLSKRSGNVGDVNDTVIVNGLTGYPILRNDQSIKIAAKQKHSGSIALKF